ncbi:hypothetical protein NH340_JMT05495 [Sarcoptes scabiei]|nr:hypothetical protein NH340_JMT05495 [Sarcoptes scabiei]
MNTSEENQLDVEINRNTSTPLIDSILLDINREKSNVSNPLLSNGIIDPIDGIDSQSLELDKCLIESSLSDNVLLQNVQFDTNFFERVPMDLASSSNHSIDLSRLDDVEDEQILSRNNELTLTSATVDPLDDSFDHSVLEALEEFPLFKDGSQSIRSMHTDQFGSQSEINDTFLSGSSSDPMVSSTTAYPPFDSGQFLVKSDECDLLDNSTEVVGSNVLAIISEKPNNTVCQNVRNQIQSLGYHSQHHQHLQQQHELQPQSGTRLIIIEDHKSRLSNHRNESNNRNSSNNKFNENHSIILQNDLHQQQQQQQQLLTKTIQSGSLKTIPANTNFQSKESDIELNRIGNNFDQTSLTKTILLEDFKFKGKRFD